MVYWNENWKTNRMKYFLWIVDIESAISTPRGISRRRLRTPPIFLCTGIRATLSMIFFRIFHFYEIIDKFYDSMCQTIPFCCKGPKISLLAGREDSSAGFLSYQWNWFFWFEESLSYLLFGFYSRMACKIGLEGLGGSFSENFWEL